MTFAEIMQLKGKEAGLSFTAQQLEQFSAYYELLVETNKVMNLTAITEPEEVAVKHMIDSLLAFDEKLFGEKTLADVGTGAGFPGIPLKIYCPSLKVTLIDSLAKRLKFLETVIIELGLKGIRCVHLRAEDAGRDPRHREKYDLVTARAVARLSVLAEYCLPLEAGRAEMGTKHSSKAIEVVRVPLAKVIPNPYQPRKTFDEDGLQDLAASIAQYGVLQPLLVAPMEDGSGNYLLIAGERRLRASKMAALSEIPVIISDYTQQQIAEIALIENLQREDLHYLEEAEGYEMLMNEFHLTQDSMAARVGKKQSTIANKLRLLRLPQPVRESLRKNALTERHARVLLKLPTEAEQLQIVETIVKNNFSVRQTEEYVKKYLDTDEGEVTPKKKRLVIVNDVRIYLNSIKQIVSTIKDVGIPVSMEQDVDGGDVLVTLRIRNTKKPKEPRLF